MSWRRLAVFIRNLPRESATQAALDVRTTWTNADYLLASIADILHAANWQRGGDPKAKRPKALLRPGEVPPEPPSPERMAEIRARIQAYDEAHRPDES